MRQHLGLEKDRSDKRPSAFLAMTYTSTVRRHLSVGLYTFTVRRHLSVGSQAKRGGGVAVRRHCQETSRQQPKKDSGYSLMWSHQTSRLLGDVITRRRNGAGGSKPRGHRSQAPSEAK